MNKKISLMFLTLLLSISMFSGCARKQESAEKPTPNQTSPDQTTPDVKTSASIVNSPEAFEKAISANGTWLIALTQDLAINKDLVVDGEYKNGKKDANGKDIIQRKIALYAQDDKRNVTARYTLTAPKMTFNSPEGSIQHGTFKGDLYISAKNFKLVDATIEGNVYFTTEDAQSTFKMDDKSKITGKKELRK